MQDPLLQPEFAGTPAALSRAMKHEEKMAKLRQKVGLGAGGKWKGDAGDDGTERPTQPAGKATAKGAGKAVER